MKLMNFNSVDLPALPMNVSYKLRW